MKRASIIRVGVDWKSAWDAHAWVPGRSAGKGSSALPADQGLLLPLQGPPEGTSCADQREQGAGGHRHRSEGTPTPQDVDASQQHAAVQRVSHS